jgi:hypothetical protein
MARSREAQRRYNKKHNEEKPPPPLGRGTPGQLAAQAARLRGDEPPGFQVVGEETHGLLVAQKVRRMGQPVTMTILGCPNCFDVRVGGGIIVDGFCSNCGASTGHIPLEVENPRQARTNRPSSNRISWLQEYDGQTLLQHALAAKRGGQPLQKIAANLTELCGRPIAPQNVAAHLHHAAAKAASHV